MQCKQGDMVPILHERNLKMINKPKRTFKLNGAELPCPVDWKESSNGDVAVIDGEVFWFKNKMDAELVRNTLSKIFTEARDKP